MHDRFNFHIKDQRTSPKKINAENEIAVGDFAVVYPNNGDVRVNLHKLAEDERGRKYIIMNKAESHESAMKIIETNQSLGMKEIYLARIIEQVVSTRRRIGTYYKIQVEKE